MNYISHAFHRTFSRNWPCIYFAIDIHDTIFKGTYEKNNDSKAFYPFAKEVLQNLSLNPRVKLIIYTASHEGPARDVIKWLESHDIKIFALNENPDHKGTDLCDFSKKFYFDILLEDKAGFEGWHDWFKIMKELQRMGEWLNPEKEKFYRMAEKVGKFYNDDELTVRIKEYFDKGYYSFKKQKS